DEWIDKCSFRDDSPEKLGTSNTTYGPNLSGTVCRTVSGAPGGCPNVADGTPRPSTDRFARDGVTVSTDTYQWHASGRWMIRSLQVAKPGQPGVYGPDLIDRWKGRAFQQSPDSTISLVGFEDEQVNWQANDILMGERAGPVRASREIWGADSGTNVTNLESFYRDAITYHYHELVHPIPPDGLYTSWDHHRGADASGRVVGRYARDERLLRRRRQAERVPRRPERHGPGAVRRRLQARSDARGVRGARHPLLLQQRHGQPAVARGADRDRRAAAAVHGADPAADERRGVVRGHRDRAPPDRHRAPGRDPGHHDHRSEHDHHDAGGHYDHRVGGHYDHHDDAADAAQPRAAQRRRRVGGDRAGHRRERHPERRRPERLRAHVLDRHPTGARQPRGDLEQ